MNSDNRKPGDGGDAEVARLRGWMKEALPGGVLPSWFTPRLMQAVRDLERGSELESRGREGRGGVAAGGRVVVETPLGGGWAEWVRAMLAWRVAVPVLGLALAVGAWWGYWEATESEMHLAEVRFLDVVDPVQRHQ